MTSSYKRSSDLDWVTKDFGDEIVGYDLCAYIRQWVTDEGFEGRSLCEIVLVDDRFKKVRREIGDTNLFWSHLQQVEVLKTLARIEKSFGHLNALGCKTGGVRNGTQKLWQIVDSPNAFVWLDYFCLRQAGKGDFKVEAVVDLIAMTGTMVAEIKGAGKEGYGYLKRSFCMLEVYAAMKGKVTLMIDTDVLDNTTLDKELQLNPIDCMAAQTRKASDKTMIDDFIKNDIGIAEMNKAIASAVRGGTMAGNLIVAAEWIQKELKGENN
jgi:hypothetical protein